MYVDLYVEIFQNLFLFSDYIFLLFLISIY